MSLASALAHWSSALRFEDLPRDVVDATRLRVMDIIGLSLAGTDTPLGRSTREAVLALSPPGPCTVIGEQGKVGVTFAALANGTFSQALEYDDTHNESIVHMSSPAVAAGVALAETTPGQTTRGVPVRAACDIVRRLGRQAFDHSRPSPASEDVRRDTSLAD
jgi:2-methylcitrate dehydratase PrpD